MSNYTTGEMAKLCNVSVRTVQFYDHKGVLHPSSESEGGRRIYSDDDLTKLRLICQLKAIGLSLDSIKGVLGSELSGNILSILLDDQINMLSNEIEERQKQLEMINIIKESIANKAIVPAKTILDVEYIMENNSKIRGRRKLRLIHIGVGIFCLTQIALLAYLAHLTIAGKWWPIAVYLLVSALGIFTTLFDLKSKEFVCPNCKAVFKPSLWRAFFTTGNNKVRWTECPKCGHKDWCIIRTQKAVK